MGLGSCTTGATATLSTHCPFNDNAAECPCQRGARLMRVTLMGPPGENNGTGPGDVYMPDGQHVSIETGSQYWCFCCMPVCYLLITNC